MDPFVRFRAHEISERSLDALLGFCMGVAADDIVTKDEALALRAWLAQKRGYVDHPILGNLVAHLDSVFADDRFDADEARELLVLLKRVGGPEAPGEISRATTLPLCSPVPPIAFPDQLFAFTGTCAFGTRKQCELEVTSRGGRAGSGVVKALNYLVIGSYVTDSWLHETFGTKILKAVEYRDRGLPLAIVSEQSWLEAAGLA